MHEQVKSALHAIGDRHRYQNIIFLIFFLFNGFINLLMVGPTFIFMNPLFICLGHDTPVDEAIACPIIDQCTICTHSCILESDFTLTAHMGLYCQRQDDRDTVQYMLMVGSFFGTFIVNVLSESRGRKIALLLSCFSGLVGLTGTI